MPQPRVIVDNRERSSGVPDILKEKGLDLRFQNLDVADYLVSDCAIERKSTRDFISSLYSGRLFDQARRLTSAYDLPLLIVEGDVRPVLIDMANPRAYWGALISLTLKFKLQAFFTRDREETADLIHIIGRQSLSGEGPRTPIVVKKPRIETVADAQLAVLEVLPGIGPVLADKLLREFGSLRKVLNASEVELNVKAGLGRAKSKKITDLLHARYNPTARRGVQSRL